MKTENNNNKSNTNPLPSTENPKPSDLKTQSESTTKTAPEAKWYKKKAILVILIILILFGGGAVAWTLINMFNKTEDLNTNQTNTQASTKYKVAYIFDSNLWVSDLDGQNSKEVGNSKVFGNLQELYGWTPDNKLVFARVEPDYKIGSEKITVSYYVLIDPQDGAAITLDIDDNNAYGFDPEDVDSNFVWTSNNTLVYVSKNNEVHQVDSRGGNKKLVTLLKHDFEELNNKSISANGQYVAYAGYYRDFRNVRFSGQVYVYDIESGSDKLVTDQATALLGWTNNSVVYVKDNKVYSYGPQTGTEQSVLDLPSDIDNTSIDFISNPNILTYSYFSVEARKKYLDIFNTTNKQKVYFGEFYLDTSIVLGDFTKDGNYFAYATTVYSRDPPNQEANVLDLNTKTVHQLCKGGYLNGEYIGNCKSPVFSN